MSTIQRGPVPMRPPARRDLVAGRRPSGRPRTVPTAGAVPGPARPRVLVADPAPLWREGLARLLEDAGMRVVGRVEDLAGMVEIARRARPDVVVVDPRIAAADTDESLRTARWVRRALPGVAVLVLGPDADPCDAIGRAGASGVGYLVKDRVRTAADLAAAVECVAMGGSVVDVPTGAPAAAGAGGATGSLRGLSERELEVLALIAEGVSNAAIAERLAIAGKTVDSHVGRILAKLGLGEDAAVNRRVSAALMYHRAGSADRHAAPAEAGPA